VVLCFFLIERYGLAIYFGDIEIVLEFYFGILTDFED